MTDHIHHLDLADIYNQLVRSATRQQYVFNLMLVGRTGCGKTTLVNTLFKQDQLEVEDDENTTGLNETTLFLEENGVRLRLRYIESRGFGDCIDNSGCSKPLVDYIQSKYYQYVCDDLSLPRHEVEDNRVHCCLYFIEPNVRPLKKIDIDCLKALHNRVNIIPVIAKSDTLSPEECQRFKQIIKRDLDHNQIKTYQFPEEKDEDGDESGRATTINRMRECAPFAVVGSSCVEKHNGQLRRVRKSYWGTRDVYDPRNSDVYALSKLLIRLYMVDLIDTTHCIHYSNFIEENLEKTPEQLFAQKNS